MQEYKAYEIYQWKKQKEAEKAQKEAEEMADKIGPVTTKEERKRFWNLQRIKIKQVDE